MRQHHITDETNKKAINNIAQKYYNVQGSNTDHIKHLCASRAQNDALNEKLAHSVQAQHSGVRIEKFKAQRKEILMRSVLNLYHCLLSLFFIVLTLVTERGTQLINCHFVE